MIKKIKKAIKIWSLIVILMLSNKSFSQSDDLFQCDQFPTTDSALNSNIRDLVAQNTEFETRMGAIYGNLSSEEQQRVDSYINNSDESLFSHFPQFDNNDLKNSVTLIKDKYSIVWNKHEEVFPHLDTDQRAEIIKTIIQCASSKIRIDGEGSLEERMADDCEKERINCIASVAAQAATMHLVCAYLDLTVIAGIICHGAAFTYQWTAGNNCNIAARRCREAQ